MKRILTLIAAAVVAVACGNAHKGSQPAESSQVQDPGAPVVYFTKEITPESLVAIYEALGREATGRVAVKISTGEAGGHNYLKPELIGSLVKKVNGTIVECNTAYGGARNTVADHMKVAEDHGFTKIAKVDIMDADGEFNIPVQDTKYLKYDIVGTHLKNYDFMINLAHFKGHAMGGFGGVLKNQSIGVASRNGKAYIHTAGKTSNPDIAWGPQYLAAGPTQDSFLESMAAAAQGVHEYFKGGKNILYINVMNNMSVDCDCDSHPADPKVADMGIVASLDPVACDQACLDMVFGHKNDVPGDDAKPLQQRINRQHGTYITEYAEKIGLGSKQYRLVSLDK
ncbi:MAG: DUF362 domain-containing protein [Bacteroidales bacterium]|jgi:uncharacterized Fe-S center protein|nr:DUF362 domain-containing protein [Bacteroidales bacterium]